jgi:hypothetical protein
MTASPANRRRRFAPTFPAMGALTLLSGSARAATSTVEIMRGSWFAQMVHSARSIVTGPLAVVIATVLITQSLPLRAQTVNQSSPDHSVPASPAASQSVPAKMSAKPDILTLDPRITAITTQNGTVLKLGAACERHTDNHAGIIRSDPCYRWYCGRADKKSINEVLPNLAEETGCTWRVEASNQCVCRKSANAAPGK